MVKNFTLICLGFFMSCCLLTRTCVSLLLPTLKMFTSAQICFSTLVSTAKMHCIEQSIRCQGHSRSLCKGLAVTSSCTRLQKCDSWCAKRESKWSGFGLKSHLTALGWSWAMYRHGLLHELRSQWSGLVSSPPTRFSNPVSTMRWGVWCNLIC